jgi:hypothetical protein
MQTRVTALFLAILAMLAIGAGDAAMADELEDRLAAAVVLAPSDDALDRIGRIDAVLGAYAQAGLIGTKPDFRIDYDDYYVLRRPARFRGYTLAAIEVENMGEFIGCCVDEGVILLLRDDGGGDEGDLDEFAGRSGCRTLGYLDAALGRNKQHTARRFPKGEYVSLSCRVHDADNR